MEGFAQGGAARRGAGFARHLTTSAPLQCKFEAVTTELGMAAAEVQGALRNLDAWMAPEKRDTPLAMLPGKSFVHNDPQGVVLIIAPFNYPLQLSICPLAGFDAAGPRRLPPPPPAHPAPVPTPPAPSQRATARC